jgi:hypothetical protein
MLIPYFFFFNEKIIVDKNTYGEKMTPLLIFSQKKKKESVRKIKYLKNEINKKDYQSLSE